MELAKNVEFRKTNCVTVFVCVDRDIALCRYVYICTYMTEIVHFKRNTCSYLVTNMFEDKWISSSKTNQLIFYN